MRKLVVLVMAMVLCLSMVQVAQAACSHPPCLYQHS